VSRFLLRCTITAACVVALSSSAALGQSDPAIAAPLAERSMPTVMAPTLMAPTIMAPTMTAPEMALPTIVTPTIATPTTEPSLAVRPINDDVASVVRRRESFGRPAVLMITGGALLLTGLLVDGDASSILIISGAAIGGYGLYLHLQSPNARLVR
jgi:hypothetical protein